MLRTDLLARRITRRQALLAMASGAAVLMLGGCAQSGVQRPAEQATPPAADAISDGSSESAAPASSAVSDKPLIIYFSLPEATSAEEMTPEGENSTVTIDGEVLGNVQYLAQLVAGRTGGKLARVETVEPYDVSDHEALIAYAQRELNSGSRPELQASGIPTPEDIASASAVFLGYPIWWADLPTPYYTLLESIDLAGKTVIPFVCHGGSGFAGTRETIAELQPDADVRAGDGYSVSRNAVADSAPEVERWLEGLGY